MQYVNVPDALPENVYYATFFSRLYNHALGYCVYLPAAALQKACPAHYHFHGWQGQECSDVFAMEPVYQNGETIFVFPNVSYELEGQTNLPVERMVFEELIPEIERKYQAAGRRSISGFSMVSTFRNWEVPREAFRASPATQATYPSQEEGPVSLPLWMDSTHLQNSMS